MKKAVSIFSLICVLFTSSCGGFKELTFTGVENINITGISKEGIEAELSARIKNPNRLSFTIYKSNMNVSLSGIDVGTAQLTNRVHIKGKSENTYTFKVKSDFSNLNLMDLPGILSIAMSGNVKTSIKGNLKVGKLFIKKAIPVDITETVSLHSN